MRTWLTLIALSACEHGQTPLDDGGGPGDDGDVACDKASAVEGELIDWDSTDASFLGVNGASVSLRFDPAFGTVTPPNGRVSFCSRPDFPLEFAFDAPDDYFDGTMSIERDVLQNGGTPSLRIFTVTRAVTFFVEQGLTFDSNAAQIVVLQTGDRFPLTLDLPHDAPVGGNDDGGGGVVTWGAAADTGGRYVLFPNVDTTGVATAQVAIDMLGQSMVVPVAPGKLTLVAMSFFLVGP